MMQSQLLRSASLCQRYWSSPPSTWSITQPQSRSDHVPGNTTTPNFIATTAREGNRGSPRNRRFRGVRIRRLQTSPALVAVHFNVEAVVLDHVVGQQLLAHRLYKFAWLVLAARLKIQLDVLADAHVGYLPKAKRRKALLDRDALRVVHDWLGGNNHSSDQRSFLGLGGNSGLPTRRWYAVRYRSRVCATTSSGRRGGSDSLSQPARVSQSRTNCLSYESGDVPIW